MAVSKRTRFEVLRRDNYTCRYCRSTESKLTVDHVTPVTLGGTDDLTNLVAACRDCNAGKSSTVLEAEKVADVSEDALRWAKAMAEAAAEREGAAAPSDLLGDFYDHWMGFSPDAELPNGWESSVARFHENGMTQVLLRDAASTALTRDYVASWHKFRYFCGVCWKVVGELREAAEAKLAENQGSD